jgi:hypothetical protein
MTDLLGGTALARSVTAVGGTTSVPEVAAEFSGGGFSNVVRFASLFWPCNDNLDKETL